MTRAYNTATTQQNSGGAVAGVTAGKNAIINGGMDIWQRGTSFSSGGGLSIYGADRWHTYRGLNESGGTFSRQTSGLNGFQYAMRLQRNSGNTSNQSLGLRYTLESADSYKFAGKTVTLSFYLRKGADYSGTNFRATIASGTGTDQPVYAFTGFTYAVDQNVAPTTSWVRYSVTGTIPSNATEVGLEMFSYASGTAGTNDYVDVTGFQLEVGSVPTDFARAGGTIQGELAACQRYYWRNTSDAQYGLLGAAGFIASATSAVINVQNPVPMRTSASSVDFLNVLVQDGNSSNFVPSSGAIDAATNTKYGTGFTFAVTGATTGRVARLLANNTTNAYIGVSAEL